MHLLLSQKGTIADEGEALDLGQTIGEIAVFSTADTEIASLAAARARRGDDKNFLRLVNFLSLKHPLSIDQWIDKTGRFAKLIIVRALGGESYWPYGLEALHAAAVNHKIMLAVLPGDDKPDAGLARFCTLPAQHCEALWRYLVEGGAQNCGAFLAYVDALIGGGDLPVGAAPLLKAGIFANAMPQQNAEANRPSAAIIFYRALLQSGQTEAIMALAKALELRGILAVPIYVTSLKDEISVATVSTIFDDVNPDIVLNTTGFAVSTGGKAWTGTVLDSGGAQVLQVVLSSSTEEAWAASANGLTSRDLAMNIALPEVDGRVMTRAISFKAASTFDEFVQTNIVAHRPKADRVDFVAELAAKWVKLQRTEPAERRVALVLANYPNRDGRIANGVGLDTPAATIEVLRALKSAGYVVADVPESGDDLVRHLQEGVTNSGAENRVVFELLELSKYQEYFEKLPLKIQNAVVDRWGNPASDPLFVRSESGLEAPGSDTPHVRKPHGNSAETARAPHEGGLAVALRRFGNVMVGIQPARGYNIDPKQSYHSPDLVPPHSYFAFYFYLREVFGVHAIVHMGKHGNMEWLPGKSLGLSNECYPEATFGPMPHVYPFIVNDPGEGTQAKRRSSAVIIDHLTPPLTRAENYGALKDLETLVDEYYQADARRIKLLGPRILELVGDLGLDHDAGIARGDDEGASLEKLDAFLCDLKEMQIRDGLHIFGLAPEGRLLDDLVVALARLPRGDGLRANGSLHRAIAADLLEVPPSVGYADISPARGEIKFDPLDCVMAESWVYAKPATLSALSSDPWRTKGDTVERIELLASALVNGAMACPEEWAATSLVLDEINARIRPSVVACGEAEMRGLLTALDGRFVPPGPSGAPTRGRPDVLPTGRNFHSVDSRAVPTETAWELGKKSAELLCLRHRQDHGDDLRSVGITAWGTSNMRTGGDDIAQAMALIGAKPVWERASGRVTGFEIIQQAILGRPRVDVTLRISGFFRDAFPDQISLFDRAARAVGQLDEDGADNPLAARMRAEAAAMIAAGVSEGDAQMRSGYRVFGSMPGSYGAGLQALIDEKGWADRKDLGEAYLTWGGYAYGAAGDGVADRAGLEARLAGIEAVVQNQDNREHDLLDSDDYYQFEGGMTAAIEAVSGRMPVVYHNDHSRPEKPVIRTLEEEISRVVRARVVNPKWIAGVMRHGYKGAFEMTATLDYMFAFAATTGAVKNHHFDAAYQAFMIDDKVREFMADSNPHALREMAERFLEALERGLWTAKSNSAKFELERIIS